MSLAGYLVRSSGVVRRVVQPAYRHGVSGPEMLPGVHTEGPVLRGEKSPEEQRALNAAEAGYRDSGCASEAARDGESYRGVEHYDVVLRNHCRL